MTNEQREQARRELGFDLIPCGRAAAMVGTGGGFTVAAFRSEDVPAGTEVYIIKEVTK